MEEMISMFIDDELDLNEKVKFVEKVHRDKAFKDDSIELLKQETLISSDVVNRSPQLTLKILKRPFLPILRPLGLFASAAALTAIILFSFMSFQKKDGTIPYRFVIYRPDVSQAEIIGSFTQWKAAPMKKAGNKGYWETTLIIPIGEHKFSYILDRKQRFADPTILTRELDDLGGENSILLMEEEA